MGEQIITRMCALLGFKVEDKGLKDFSNGFLFNDYDLNVYFETGEAQLPYSDRKHDLSDGIVICGLNSLVNAIQYDNTAICLNYNSKINGNLDISENINILGNIEASTYSTGGQAGISGTFVDTGQGASGKTLTITNGLITEIN